MNSFFPGAGKAAAAPPPRWSGRPDAKSILAVGSCALVVDPASSAQSIALSDEPGHLRLGVVRVGAEVQVTAWRPRGGWGTRYRIRLADGREGWVEAGSLRPRAEPTPPRRSDSSASAVPAKRPKKRAAKPQTS